MDDLRAKSIRDDKKRIEMKTKMNPASASDFVEINPKFIGIWMVTEDCEKHELWPVTLTIEPQSDQGGRITIRRGDLDPSPFNYPLERFGPDQLGEVYKTITEVTVLGGGRTVVLASIWNRIPPSPPNLATFLSTYTLDNENQLTFQKFGYTSFDDNGSMIIKPYKDYFPNNYRCIYRRLDGL